MPDIDIAVSLYNCAPWLADFKASLLAQQTGGWRVVARDDGSSDETPRLLAQWGAELGEKIAVLQEQSRQNLGVAGSFTAVLAATSAPWVMLADPDDVWLPGKIKATQNAMREAEARWGSSTPIVVCTDARVVDAALNEMASSYWRLYRMKPQAAGRMPGTAIENEALGSTMMVNRALVDLALPIDAAAAYQDWWLALVGAAFGKIVTLPQQTILYRRHGSNETESPYSASLSTALRRTARSPADARRRITALVDQAASQAAAFASRYRNRLTASDLAALEALASTPSRGWMGRRWVFIRHGIWFGSWIKNFGLLAFG